MYGRWFIWQKIFKFLFRYSWIVPLKPNLLKKTPLVPLFILLFCLPAADSFAQMITGVWKGRIGKQKAEVKFIQDGDSLTGTSYYYESTVSYRRYSIKGYFDEFSNAVVWWDDQLLEEKNGRLGLGSPGNTPLMSQADFNCPGGGKMMLDGKSVRKTDPNFDGPLHLDKTDRTVFADEWDFVIENFMVGGNNPDIIDSVAQIAFQENTESELPRRERNNTPLSKKAPPANGMVSIPPMQEKPELPVKTQTIEEKFVARTPKYVMDIPLKGDSIELRFYDNAEIDGDSISLFLNEKLVFQHIRLLATPYIVRLAISDLQEVNELVMVAENLGKIPPNTSYMIAEVDGQRFEANLQSTEEISAMIKLIKPKRE